MLEVSDCSVVDSIIMVDDGVSVVRDSVVSCTVVVSSACRLDVSDCSVVDSIIMVDVCGSAVGDSVVGSMVAIGVGSPSKMATYPFF
jgi:hypothetical protein